MLRIVAPRRRCAATSRIVLIASLLTGATPTASAGSIVATFERNPVGNFVSQYEEGGMIFTSENGAGLSFLNNIINGDIGLFEATAGAPFAAIGVLPTLADSVTVRFFLAHDDLVTLSAYDDRDVLIDTISSVGPASPFEYLTLTVEADTLAIAKIRWIGSTDTILVAGDVTANIVPGPGTASILTAMAAFARQGRGRRRPTR